MQVHFTPEQEAQIAKVAGASGMNPEAFVKDAALQSLERARLGTSNEADEAVRRILELQKDVKPDPEGWTVNDYINYGRP